MGKIIISQVWQNENAKPNYQFFIIARNGNRIATSLTCANLSLCKKLIQSVIRTVEKAKFEDECPQGGEVIHVTNPKFELLKDRNGAFFFRLRARNGELLLQSGTYTTKASCKNGIESVKKSVVDVTIIEKKA